MADPVPALPAIPPAPPPAATPAAAKPLAAKPPAKAPAAPPAAAGAKAAEVQYLMQTNCLDFAKGQGVSGAEISKRGDYVADWFKRGIIKKA